MIRGGAAFYIFVIVIMLGCVSLLSSAGIFAADQERSRQQIQKQEREQIYGSQLMTEQKREAYRSRMRMAETEEERERIRNEHHEQMQERAREQGKSMPDEPPERGMGKGMGPGGGMGSGGGGMKHGGGKR
jgi:hypothetical protein